MIKAGIIGGAGYTAGELIRLILLHPGVALDFVYSTSNAENEIQRVHRDLIGDTTLMFCFSVSVMGILNLFYRNMNFRHIPGSLT
jgi:N-acetyl-gamma-glutamyl-phosphate reductase